MKLIQSPSGNSNKYVTPYYHLVMNEFDTLSLVGLFLKSPCNCCVESRSTYYSWDLVNSRVEECVFFVE